MKVLLAEDEKRMNRALCELLRQEGYDVDAFENGEDALFAIESGIYDLIVLDVMMPGMNGYAVAKQTRKAGIRTPILMLTAEMIRPYVEKDPTKFCTTEDFDKGVETLSKFVSLRAEAVSRQLNGDDAAVETGDLDLSVMGSMGGGMGSGRSTSFSGQFDLLSMVTLTDKDGSETTLSALAAKDVSVESVTLSDGTTVSLSETDMKDLMKLDLSKLVSATDKDGNEIDLSAYTVSVNRPSGRSGEKDSRSKAAPDQNEPDSTDASRPDGTTEAQPAEQPDGQSGGTQRSGSERPSMPNGGSFPSGGAGDRSSEATFWIWVGVSVLVLAVGLIAAVKKKG